MQLKKALSMAMGLSTVALLSLPALADHINARIKSTDATAHTITVTEKHQDIVFNVDDTTKYVDAKGAAVPMDNWDALTAGTRLSITFDKKDDKSVASEIKLRDKNSDKPAPAAPAPAPAPAQ